MFNERQTSGAMTLKIFPFCCRIAGKKSLH
jgi:hypothetical protein